MGYLSSPAFMQKTFRTIVSVSKPAFKISHSDKLISIGSCFSENIGKKFLDYKFRINVNPFGQQYNPYSIATAINRLLSSVPYTEKDLVFHDELYHSFDHHGSFSRNTAEETLRVINENLLQAAADLRSATVLFLTFGTSHVFELKDEEQKIVSNCHKLSGTNFTKRLMPPGEITLVLDNSLKELKKINPAIQLVLTVSPVRYFAFGHHENTVSKAHLFSALHQLEQQNPDYYYFPAYELVMDDLRDYRFFAEDMLHPNYQATDYVWQSLAANIIEPKTQELMKDIDELLLAARHKPRNPKSEAHKKFVQKNLTKIDVLEKLLNLNFEEEKAQLAKYL